MSDKLVIVESPSKATTIKKYLGKGYNVVASMGHVIDLPKSQLAIDVENNFDPKQVIDFREKYMSACDGHSTKRIMELVFEDRLDAFRR